MSKRKKELKVIYRIILFPELNKLIVGKYEDVL